MSPFTHRLPHEPFPKPSRNEDEYFHRLEIEQRMARARQREEERARAERARLKALHEGHCPGCGAELQEVRARDGIVHQCPVCRGVWMDQAMFDRLTHQEEASYLGGIFRGLLLDYTLGEIPTREPPAKNE